MNSNLNPKRIALYVSIAFGLFLGVILWIFAIDFMLILAAVLSFGGLSFVVLLYVIQSFVYNKIKLIYKSIHYLKSNKSNKINFFKAEDLIENVKADVVSWAADQDKKFNTLVAQEEYRREFLANISHELKTPIFSIQGYIHTLLDGAMDDENVKVKFLEKAAKNADRLQELVEDLININRLEKGDTILNLSAFNIYNLSKEVWENLEILSDNTATKLVFKDNTKKNVLVKADKEEITKVLENLLTNSIKYGAENGTTTISFDEMGSNILIEVTDNGDGIEANEIPRLFERFYRVEKSRSRAMGGTGLGLSIVKHIVESHKQTINVRSKVGVGTTFGFTLPKAKGSA